MRLILPHTKDGFMATNRYIDTRGRCAAPVTFTEAVVKGLAEGGGLFVPETLPKPSVQPLSIARLASTCLTPRSMSSWTQRTATDSMMRQYALLRRSTETPMFSSYGMVPPAPLRTWRFSACPISLVQAHPSCASRENWKTPSLSWSPLRATPAKQLSKGSATRRESRLR